MKTYLDMDEILRHCRRYIGQEYDEPYLVSAVPEEVIRSLPSANVVEMVRCRECIYWGGEYADNECSLITKVAIPKYWLKTQPEDYCSSGKKKPNVQSEI